MKMLSAVLTALLLSACAGSGTTAPEKPRASGDESHATKEEESAMLAVGTTAPGFDTTDEKGNSVRLADFKGKKNVVLVFYPGDDTPGCTSQLCAIRDDWKDFEDAGVAVFGINPAKAESKQKFSGKYGFPFPLLPDTEKKLVKSYGCEGLLFTKRTVYGIDKEGTIVFAERGMPKNADILAAFAGKS